MPLWSPLDWKRREALEAQEQEEEERTGSDRAAAILKNCGYF